MASMTEAPQAVSVTPSHEYNARANVLSGELQRPIIQKIEPQAPVSIEGRRGGLFARSVQDVSIEGLISLTKGQTRVSGARSLKHQGWVTLATSVLAGFNVFETLTSDRVVSQVSTDHPYENGHFPLVTFLGTQFGDLRISGFPVPLTLNLGICGPKPKDDRSYLRDLNFLTNVKNQTQAIAKANGLPKDIKDRYIQRLERADELIRTKDDDETAARPEVVCSMVQSIDVSKVDRGLGVQAFGHVLVIPEFGSVSLGEVEVGENMYQGSTRPCVYFELKSMKIKLGCLGDGSQEAGSTKTNGQTYP
ncbi:MAG: hypothetical protein WA824_07425 [Candidatus Sulfotelmatobacter sp.]